MKFWSTNRLAILGSTSFETTNRRKNSYTICKCGHARSREGSSSSGSEKARGSLFLVWRARKMFAPTMLTTSCIKASLKQFRVLLTYSTISKRVWRLASFSFCMLSLWKSKTTAQTSIFLRKRSVRSCGGASRNLGIVAKLEDSVAGFVVAARLLEELAGVVALLFAARSPDPEVLPPLLVAPVRLVDVFLSPSFPIRRFTVWISFMTQTAMICPPSHSLFVT
mmetsp:Transcript_79403/g.125311  ORF Transcript_79403/g.125311 Transcript_79403/m.125311 type:complete len:223 (-) Transcript_79403:65-733(-)